VYQADATKVLETLNGPYQVVLLDPPYRLQNLGEVLEKIASVPGLVDDQGIVVVERYLTQDKALY